MESIKKHIVFWLFKLFGIHFSFSAIVHVGLRNVKDFYFVQIGANDGLALDPIYHAVLKNKWKGVLIEPQKEYFDKLKINYANHQEGLIFLNVAIAETNGKRKLYKVKKDCMKHPWDFGIAALTVDRGDISKFDSNDLEVEEVDAMTMSSLIHDYHIKKIDLLQIDVEGYDYEIIKQIDFYQFSPALIRYEHYHLKPEEQQDCENYLRAKGYNIYRELMDTVAYSKNFRSLM